ncbi:glucose-1-phosphate adenylyltransferase [Haloimpatiens sp. FM7330]|uniref:glucose-1-phosphate adenylyltransferase n=1 Tax=Haloimpatiens sp. FM7330 TaxID=3298610 RepID=UPI003627D11F
MSKKEIVAMILAGGQGSRLKHLTKNTAKPAVPFGGRYRIIDFTLSNCSNSGIDTVGVLTQYKPLTLNSHIGIGTPWDLDRINGGVTLLPPYMTNLGGDWYKGTANAIYQNIGFIDSYNPKYVLILSGDHVYKMDYSKMLKFHKEKGADATIAVIEVPMAEAHRFGIMNTTENNKIYEFEEKPKNPKNNMASMGVYIFDWEKLKYFLNEDEKDTKSSNDFGKNIIPKMLNGGENLFAYPFEGYWKDVGTVESFWQANMDMLKVDGGLDIYDNDWRIYSLNNDCPPHYVGDKAVIKNSLVAEGSVILGEVTNSVVFSGVYIDENTKIINSIVMEDTLIQKNSIVDKAIIGSNVVVKKNSVVGNSEDIVVIQEGDRIEGSYQVKSLEKFA